MTEFKEVPWTPAFGAEPKPKKKPRGRPFARGADPRREGFPIVAAGDTCPKCKAGTAQPRSGRFGPFLGCTQYPTCTFAQNTGGQPQPQPLPASTVKTAAELAAAAAAAAPAPDLQPLPQPQPAAGSLDAMITEIARRAASDTVNETRVRQMIDSALDAQTESLKQATSDLLTRTLADLPQGGAQVLVRVNDLPAVEFEGVAHQALPRIIKLAHAGFNIMLVGPAGSGKTFLGEQLAQALARDFAATSAAPGLPESAFIGRTVPNITGGPDKYTSAPFVDRYINGGVMLVDEVDNADASTMLVLNSAIANGHMTLPDGRRVARHRDFVLIASANTYGHGQSRDYVGRAALDAAFLDRFVGATITLDYDVELERRLVPEREIREAVQKLRTKCRELRLRRIVSTRAALAARKLVLQLGDSIPAAMLAITEGWTDEDRRACGVAGV